MHYNKIINALKEQTDEVILFHSGSGKDSIMLCDLMSKNFKKVHCIFMYLVKDLDYENMYIEYALKKYDNINFNKVPHYAVNSFIKNGYLGIKKDPKITLNSISKIDKKFREILGVNFSVYGFKKIDGVTRRLMLNTYENGISNTNKAYPLMDLKNQDVLDYISDNILIQPFNYGTKKPSSGCDISIPQFLEYISKKSPNDFEKIKRTYPYTENILYKYLNYETETE